MLPQKIAFVDIETTGLGVTRDRILEIGILRVENNTLVDTFQSVINPEGFVSPFSLQLTGITQEELEKAPTFFEIQEKIYDMLQDCVFVAHNVRFDYGFIRNAFKRHGKKFTAKHFCSVKLSQTLFPEERKHNLDAIISRFGFTCEKRHRAFADAKVVWDFYAYMQKKFSEDILSDAIKRIAKRTSLPIAISEATITALPEKPGVYIFYGENHIPLYVGKSVNIQERVLSHFASDHASPREMSISQQIKTIETCVTSGELGALIKESQFIKKLQPLYNRQLRILKKMYALQKRTNAKGYSEVVLEVFSHIEPDDIPNLLGIFRSKRQAQTFLIPFVQQYHLCEKLLGLEKTTTSCFAYRLGNCKGACIGEENPLAYSIRFSEAFANYSLKPWPFMGPVVISEEDSLEETAEYFLVDKWCLLAQYTAQDSILQETAAYSYTFDLDTYKLLVRFLEKKKNWKNIQVLSKNHATNSINL